MIGMPRSLTERALRCLPALRSKVIAVHHRSGQVAGRPQMFPRRFTSTTSPHHLPLEYNEQIIENLNELAHDERNGDKPP